MRPDNLDPQRLPMMRAVLDRQCVHFHSAATDIDDPAVRSLFSLDKWAHHAHRLADAMSAELDTAPADSTDVSSTLSFQFALSVAVVRHLQLDPLLPAELIKANWPSDRLYETYRRFDDAFKHRMNNAYSIF